MSGLSIFDIDDPRWMESVALVHSDVFYSAEFCRFRYSNGEGRPLMLHYTDDLGSVLDVTVSRQVAQLPFFADCAGEFPVSSIDFVSPEYNGPIATASCVDRQQLLRNYRRAVDTYFHDCGAVTEFVRMHPLNDSVAFLETIEPLVVASNIFYVDLTAGYEAAAKKYRKRHRRMIRYAIETGATAEIVEPTTERIGRLADVYRDTINRNSANAYYQHDAGFFQSLFATLGNRALLIEARGKDGSLAAMFITIAGNRCLWQLYGGTVKSQRDTGANHLGFDCMIRWGAENGYDALMMGGGVVPGDGIESFKCGFSSLSAPIRHMRKIHNRPLFTRLVQAKTAFDLRRGREPCASYFPPYWLT